LQSIEEAVMSRSLRLAIVIGLVVPLLSSVGAGVAVSAPATGPVLIDAVFVSDDSSHLSLTGRNLLQGGQNLEAILGGFDTPLDVTLRTATQIDAILPDGLPPGMYLLWLGYGTGGGQFDEFPLWIGPPAPGEAPGTRWEPARAAQGTSLPIPRMAWTDIMSTSVNVTAPVADLVIAYETLFEAYFPCSPYVRATVNGIPLVSTRITGVPQAMVAAGDQIASGGQFVVEPGVGPGQYAVTVQAFLDWPMYEPTCPYVTAIDLPRAGLDTASALSVTVLDR
jgi:hypothetical protein